eukprot:COSAG02_NODE_60891_length_270_cov_0.596491_2_plen_20_part_01
MLEAPGVVFYISLTVIIWQG